MPPSDPLARDSALGAGPLAGPLAGPVPAALVAALAERYRIERELGGGGMSRVFVATDPALDRQVVVKVLSPELAQGLSAERFAREIKLAAALQDPHIVPLLSAGTTADGLPYYTMPFVAGESLRARLRRGSVPLDEALRILRDVAEALEYAHAHGVVHRDVKPENILLAGRNAVVADFGIAKALSAARGASIGPVGATLTSVGTSLGTPAYMAPEQAVGDAADHRADLYAWGVVAYELLAGAHPFAHKTSAQQLIAAQLAEAPKPLDDVRPGLPPTLGTLVMRCLAKDPGERPADAAEVLAGLGGTTSSGGYAPPHAGRRAARVRPLVVAAVLVLVAALAAAGAWVARRGGAAGDAAGADALAVLPFEHQGDSADAYLTDGITDEIRGKLTSVRSLTVIARASSNQYRGSKKPQRQIAQELGVRYLLTGTVRVAGTGGARRIVVRPELVEVTKDGRPRSTWQQAFDTAATDAIGVQGEIASRVVSAMEVAVGGDDRAKLTQVATRDPQAYDAYLRGKAAVNWGASIDPIAQRAAIPLFERAVARDSTMLDAWTALTGARAMLYMNGTPSTALGAAARAAAERARALDPTGAKGHRAMGAYYRLVRKDFARARTEYEAAYRAAPRDVASVSGMASLLGDMGRIDEALRYYDEALRLDPRNALVHAVKSRLQLRLGHVAEARASAAAAAAIAPASLGVLNARLDVELAAGDSAAVRRLLGAAAQTIPQTSVLTYLGMFGISWLLDSADQERLVALAPDAYGGDHATWALVRARHAWWRGDAGARRAWGDSATRYLRAQVADVPDDFSAHGNLAEALAHAGQPAEAVREARRGLDLARAQASSDGGLLYYFALVNAAFAAAAAGDRDAALAWLAELRSMSGLFSPARVRIDPFFAPLRGDPRFEAVLRAR